MSRIITADEARALCGFLLPIVETDNIEELSLIEAICETVREETQKSQTSLQFEIALSAETFHEDVKSILSSLRDLGYHAEANVTEKNSKTAHVDIWLSWKRNV